MSPNEIFQTERRIPWAKLGWKENPIFLKECMGLKFPRKAFIFTVPKDIGAKILIDAGRNIPVQIGR
jgi:hypothetical protein